MRPAIILLVSFLINPLLGASVLAFIVVGAICAAVYEAH